jgi:hypothetical protein
MQRRAEAQKAALELAAMEEELRAVSAPPPVTKKVLEVATQSRRSEAVPAADVRALQAQISAAARSKGW